MRDLGMSNTDFLLAMCPYCYQTNSVKALKETVLAFLYEKLKDKKTSC